MVWLRPSERAAFLMGGNMAHMTSGHYHEYDEPQMNKESIEVLWDEFGDVCIDDDECIDSSFCGWEFGTPRDEIWHWFDAQYSQWGGIAELLGKVEG